MKTLVKFQNPIHDLINDSLAFSNNWRSVWDREAVAFSPSVNISETNDSFQLSFLTAGFKKDDFKIEVENNVLIVEGKYETETQSTETQLTRKEYSLNSFKRTFKLPETVDVNKITAKYQDGILNVTVSKKDATLEKVVKTITIE